MAPSTDLSAPADSVVIDDEQYCPSFQHAVEVIGRRWTGSILRVIGDRALRFGEVRIAIPGLSDRLLAARLAELEAEGILSRTENHGEVRYSATIKGIGLQPVFDAIAQWVTNYPIASADDALPGRRRS